MAAYTTIDDPEAYFQAKTYTGNSSTQSITFDGDTDMQPDLVWTKKRSPAGSSHYATDVVRGVEISLFPDDSGAESDYGSDGMTAFDSDGFSLGSNAGMNGSGTTQVAWCWKESATSGFDIVGYTGNGTDDTDISHTLSAVPGVMFVKKRDADGASESWCVYHHKNTSAPETEYLRLNSTAATDDQADRWSDEVPTSSVFTVGDSDETNRNTSTYINYLWSGKQGFSKFGKYAGNGVTDDGTFIYTGFRPAFVLCKRTDSTSSGAWVLWDNKRNLFNASEKYLVVDTTGAEGSSGTSIDILSNGFKPYDAGACNISGGTFVYMAFAEAPFVNSNGVPCNAR
jgi:hypothetical protein